MGYMGYRAWEKDVGCSGKVYRFGTGIWYPQP